MRTRAKALTRWWWYYCRRRRQGKALFPQGSGFLAVRQPVGRLCGAGAAIDETERKDLENKWHTRDKELSGLT